MNKPSNPSEPNHGDTRIRVVTRGDCSQEYYPEVYEDRYARGYHNWVSLMYLDHHAYSLEVAQKLVKKHHDRKIIKTEYIKYP